MKNNIKNPCSECPFRKDSAKGWLGGETAKSTLDYAFNEADFACHKTRHKAIDKMSRCRGFLLFMRKMAKSPRYNKPLAECLNAIDFNMATKSNILSVPDFLKHHSL